MQAKNDIISARLDKLKQARGWTWRELAEALDLSVSTLMMVKSGRNKLSKKAEWRLVQVEASNGLINAPAENVQQALTLTHLSDGTAEARLKTFEKLLEKTMSAQDAEFWKQDARQCGEAAAKSTLEAHDHTARTDYVSTTPAKAALDNLSARNPGLCKLLMDHILAAERWDAQKRKRGK